MADIFLSHSTKTPFTAKVRDRLAARLRAKGFRVLLDVEGVEAGERWRAVLLRWLGECHGAVVLFSREALDVSAWVHTEATVLSWRLSRDPGFLLVPALLGDVQLEETGFDGFEPVQLREVQFARDVCDPTITEDERVDRLVEAISARFEPAMFGGTLGDQFLVHWLERLRSCLIHISNPFFLGKAAEALGVDLGRELTVVEPSAVQGLLAHALLHAKPDMALEALAELAAGLPNPQVRRELVELVKPGWVREDAARHLGPVARRAEPMERNAAINAAQDTSAEFYLARAFCCSVRTRVIKAAGAGGSADEIVARYDRELFRKCNVHLLKKDDAEKIRLALEWINSERVRAKETWFVVFDRDAIELGVPDRLRERYRGLSFLLLTGEHWDLANVPQLSNVLRVSPELRQGEEDEAHLMMGAMDAIIDF